MSLAQNTYQGQRNNRRPCKWAQLMSRELDIKDPQIMTIWHLKSCIMCTEYFFISTILMKVAFCFFVGLLGDVIWFLWQMQIAHEDLFAALERCASHQLAVHESSTTILDTWHNNRDNESYWLKMMKKGKKVYLDMCTFSGDYPAPCQVIHIMQHGTGMPGTKRSFKYRRWDSGPKYACRQRLDQTDDLYDNWSDHGSR